MIVDPIPTQRPLLLLHGFAGQPGAWDDAIVGLDAAPARVRLPGHGPEPEIVEGGFDAVVDALAAELEGAGPCDVAGYSMGARVALGLVLRHPDRVGRALLIGVNPGVRDEESREARRRWDDDWAQRIERDGVEAFAAAWAELPFFASQREGVSPDRLAGQQRDRCHHTASGLAWAMRVLGLGRMPSRWNDIAELSRPVTLLVGERDEKYVALARDLCRQSPSMRMVAAAGAGHNVVLEAPERCREALAEMLEAR
jgi:2-succinyl-6-hydroxy-2,4-cyclohexadiene-1-carboxylate synthase